MEHLEKMFTEEMTWENYGTYWHVDHMIPCISWDLFSDKEQKMCFNYKNLQPLEGKENMRKHAEFDEEDKALYVSLFEFDD